MLVDFSGAPHGGAVKLLPEAYDQPQIAPVGLVTHSIVGSGLGAYLYFRDVTGSESTFINNLDGTLWQLMPCDRVADAQVAGNSFTLGGRRCGLLSIEHADNGDPDNFAFTQAQIDSDIWLHDKLARRFGWPRRRISAPTGDGARGLGYHSMWLDTVYMRPDRTQPWTTAAGKTCPGRPVRVRQWETILLPAFINGTTTQEGFMAALTDAEQQEVLKAARQVNGAVGYGQVSFEGTVEALLRKVNELLGAVHANAALTGDDEAVIVAAVDEVKAEVQKLQPAAPVPAPAP